MKNPTGWSSEEFKTYILIYASEIDFKVTEEEKGLLDLKLKMLY